MFETPSAEPSAPMSDDACGRLKHRLVLAHLARREDRPAALLAHVGERHRLDGPAVLVTSAPLHGHGDRLTEVHG
jgi:hypothetical protein